MLHLAKAQNRRIEWQLGTAEDLSIGREGFDLVFSVDVIHHLSDRGRYFPRAIQLLQSSGKICTVTDSEWIIRQRPLSHYFPETVAPELQRYPTIDSLRALMRNAGFADIEEQLVEYDMPLPDIQAYRDKAFSALHLISDAAFQTGIARLEHDLRAGPIPMVSRYILVWGTKPVLQ